MNWLHIIKNDTNKVDDFIEKYSAEYELAKNDIKINGKIINVAQQMPAQFEKRYAQFEDVNSVVNLLEVELKKIRSQHFKTYTETYARSLKSTEIEKYIDGEVDVVDIAFKLNKALMLRNKFAGITKALDSKQYQISNIVKLKVAGLDDSDIGYKE